MRAPPAHGIPGDGNALWEQLRPLRQSASCPALWAHNAPGDACGMTTALSSFSVVPAAAGLEGSSMQRAAVTGLSAAADNARRYRRTVSWADTQGTRGGALVEVRVFEPRCGPTLILRHSRAPSDPPRVPPLTARAATTRSGLRAAVCNDWPARELAHLWLALSDASEPHVHPGRTLMPSLAK